MASTQYSKVKGRKFENEVADYLRSFFPDAKREGGRNGANDKGDIDRVPEWTIEAKAEKSINLPTYLRELDAERANRDTPFGVVVVKARGTSDAGESFCVMRLKHFAPLMKVLAECTPPF